MAPYTELSIHQTGEKIMSTQDDKKSVNELDGCRAYISQLHQELHKQTLAKIKLEAEVVKLKKHLKAVGVRI